MPGDRDSLLTRVTPPTTLTASQSWGLRLSDHPGLIHLNDHDIEANLAIDHQLVRLRAGSEEVGVWSSDECQLFENGDGRFLIRAEGDELPFTPNATEPLRNAIATLHADSGKRSKPPSRESVPPPTDPSLGSGGNTVEVVDGPPPQPVTLILFYLMAAGTALLGVWALISLI